MHRLCVDKDRFPASGTRSRRRRDRRRRQLAGPAVHRRPCAGRRSGAAVAPADIGAKTMSTVSSISLSIGSSVTTQVCPTVARPDRQRRRAAPCLVRSNVAVSRFTLAQARVLASAARISAGASISMCIPVSAMSSTSIGTLQAGCCCPCPSRHLDLSPGPIVDCRRIGKPHLPGTSDSSLRSPAHGALAAYRRQDAAAQPRARAVAHRRCGRPLRRVFRQVFGPAPAPCGLQAADRPVSGHRMHRRCGAFPSAPKGRRCPFPSGSHPCRGKNGRKAAGQARAARVQSKAGPAPVSDAGQSGRNGR